MTPSPTAQIQGQIRRAAVLAAFSVLLAEVAVAMPQASRTEPAYGAIPPHRIVGELAGERGPLSVGDPSRGSYLELFGLLQGRLVSTMRDSATAAPSVSPEDDHELGFEFRRVELGARGHVADPRLGYLVVFATEDGAAGVEQVIAQDLAVSYSLSDTVQLAFGRYFVPFLREELIGGPGSLAVGQSYMNNLLSMGRGEGLSVNYWGDDSRWQLFLNDGAGSGGGGSVNNPSADAVDLAVSARVEHRVAGGWEQATSFTAPEGESTSIVLGAGAHLQQGESGDSLPDANLSAWTADASLESDGWTVYAAVAGNHAQPTPGPDTDTLGAVAQLGRRTGQNEPFLRFEYLDFDESLGFADSDVGIATVGFNHHVNGNAKLTADAMLALDPIPIDSLNAGLLADDGNDGQLVVRLQVQLTF